eukprot:CAMPEP_0174707182 /NCGR_PEP_ID=MMETSP1094-20130205/9764_1 /TAXON_ID=156173 /ORGANISM="Chrysochromulina brevifilum, Strain UTEX LB 985" /LENGTH=130 /DNA_ID=CAMNT_0015905525 /DNA_START=78 /DNA_END=470 /DNA_ORIENTATION=-
MRHMPHGGSWLAASRASVLLATLLLFALYHMRLDKLLEVGLQLFVRLLAVLLLISERRHFPRARLDGLGQVLLEVGQRFQKEHLSHLLEGARRLVKRLELGERQLGVLGLGVARAQLGGEHHDLPLALGH